MSEARSSSPKVTIIGGGISGLCAAFDLHRAGWHVTVHESTNRWGGKIHSSLVGDRMVDAGPDAFLARVPDAINLCRELGIDDQLTSPIAPVPAYIFSEGSLHPLPTKTYLGVPTDIEQLANSTLISASGVECVAREPELGPSATSPDPSVGSICRQRLGDEVTARLVDPLIGGINASDIDRLSLAAAAPQLQAALENHGSLVTGLGQLLASAGAAAQTLGTSEPNPVFYGHPDGVATIVDRLVDELADADLRLNSPVTSLVDTATADTYGVVLATPAFVSAGLLATLSPQASTELAAIGYASVSQVTVEFPADAVHPVLDASGILFPRADGGIMTACTWLSTKWAHYHRSDAVLLRMTSGRYGDDRANELSDEALTSTLLAELSQVIEIDGQPLATRVQRWPRAFPQYEPGHRSRVDRIRQSLRSSTGSTSEIPTVALVGAAYDGIGIPACIKSGRSAAQLLINQ